jgi:hypothetical protein
MFSCGPSLALTIALLNSASGVDVCVPTRGASKWVCVFPVKDVGSDTAGAARAAALVWGIGEEGMIWGWWGMGVSGFTGPSADCKRVFITNVKGTFFGMSESEEASKRR